MSLSNNQNGNQTLTTACTSLIFEDKIEVVESPIGQSHAQDNWEEAETPTSIEKSFTSVQFEDKVEVVDPVLPVATSSPTAVLSRSDVTPCADESVTFHSNTSHQVDGTGGADITPRLHDSPTSGKSLRHCRIGVILAVCVVIIVGISLIAAGPKLKARPSNLRSPEQQPASTGQVPTPSPLSPTLEQNDPVDNVNDEEEIAPIAFSDSNSFDFAIENEAPPMAFSDSGDSNVISLLEAAAEPPSTSQQEKVVNTSVTLPTP